jgi:3-methylfumaryl-CoA hydratase
MEHNERIISEEVCGLSAVRKVASMLNLVPSDFLKGDLLPRGWHFFLLSGNVPRSETRSDGFPGFGVPIPDLGLPRLVLGGRAVEFLGDIRIGETLERTSFVASIAEKESAAGRMAFVKIQHELRNMKSELLLKEVQTFILLEASHGKPVLPTGTAISQEAQAIKSLTPDELQLFQYSALGFNSHKIHLDRTYTQEVEGYPNLLVNGGLATLYVTEFLRTQCGLQLAGFQAKHSAPLFCDDELTLLASPVDAQNWEVKICNVHHALAVSIEARINA